jgi:hypothetical protein
MTKAEFTQRVAIALAGNSKCFPYGFTEIDIVRTADRLADEFEKSSLYGKFDEGFSDANIVAAINDVEQELERGFDNLCDIR